MTNERWERLKALFQAALERDPSDRARFLDEHCQSDAILRQQLQEMLAHHEHYPDFMETPADALTVSGPFDERPRLTAGEVLDGKYRIEHCIGAGGMGVVYKVLHVGLQRVFAAKVIHAVASADPRFLHRFRVEAEALGRLEHPNILNVTDFGVDGKRDLPYLITEYLEGETLADRLRATGPLRVDAALPLLGAMSAAIDHAHRQGILHLDLKPANVFLASRNGRDQLKILDFGLARVMHRQASSDARPRDSPHVDVASLGAGDVSVRLGTPSYMAPESVRGDAPSPASDVYAFGVVAYELLTGVRPFQGSVADVLRKQIDEAPRPLSQAHAPLPSEMDAAILAALEKDPRARPLTATAVVTRIRDAAYAAATRKWRSDEIPRRAIWSAGIALLSLVLVPALSGIGLIEGIEGRTIDARFATVTARGPDPRILLLVLDDDSLKSNPAPLGAQGDRIGLELQRVFHAGARAVAIDLLLPEAWSQSHTFPQLVLRHASSLTLAAFSTPEGAVIGPECIAGTTTAALGADRAAELFGFVNSPQDSDGIHRRSRLDYQTDDGERRRSWAARAASTVGVANAGEMARPFWIDRSTDWTRLERVSWKDVSEELVVRPDKFKDRLVLVGASYAGSGDEVRLSTRSEQMVPGLILQALAVDSILSGFPGPERHRMAGVQRPGAGVICRRRDHTLHGSRVARAPRRRRDRAGAWSDCTCIVPVEPEYSPGRRSDRNDCCCPNGGPDTARHVVQIPIPNRHPYCVMTTVLWFAVAIVVVQPFRAAGTYPNAHSPEKAPAALVSAVSGSASVERPRQAALNLFDWVSDGATVRVPRGATLTLVLSSGKRFELTGPARATVTPQGLSATAGSIRQLSAMPRLPRIAPISHRKDQGRSAAVRVRGPRISNLYPFEGSVTRAQSTEFTFDTVAGATQYRGGSRRQRRSPCLSSADGEDPSDWVAGPSTRRRLLLAGAHC